MKKQKPDPRTEIANVLFPGIIMGAIPNNNELINKIQTIAIPEKQKSPGIKLDKNSEFYKQYQLDVLKTKVKDYQDNKIKSLEDEFVKLTIDDVNKLISEKITDKYDQELLLKFLSPCWTDPFTGCIFRSLDWTYYNQFRIPGKGLIGSHRLSYEIFNGTLISGMEICHNCDRKGCINPDHLFQGTHSANVQDARNKGRILPIKL